MLDQLDQAPFLLLVLVAALIGAYQASRRRK
jgi:hypothetical protein